MKKGISPGILVGVIAVIATLTVILIFISPKLTDILFSSGGQSQCQFNLLLSKTAETATFGFGKKMPVDCQTIRKTITQNDLAKYSGLASQAITSYKTSLVTADFPNNQQGKDKWALAHIIANDMTKCYDRGWKGKLGIGSLQAIEKLDAFKTKTDYLCILCTRYTFDNYASALPQFDMKPWLENNLIQSKTFYDYLTENNKNYFSKANIARSKVDTKKPLVVMYVADSAGQGAVLIAPYEQITTNLGTVLYAQSTLVTAAERFIGLPTRLFGVTENTYFGLVDTEKEGDLYSGLGVTFNTGDIVASTSSTYPMYKRIAKCSTIIGD